MSLSVSVMHDKSLRVLTRYPFLFAIYALFGRLDETYVYSGVCWQEWFSIFGRKILLAVAGHVTNFGKITD